MSGFAMASGERADMRGRITDVYLILMLLVFPLFTGLGGYTNLTFSKFIFFICLTAAWLAALAVLSLREKCGLSRFCAAEWCALAFAVIGCISALASEYGKSCILGGGRYDGLLTGGAYVLAFVGVAEFGCFKRRHAAAFGAAISICCVIAVLQLFGLNPLWLFPGDYCYYDAHIRFSSEFLGTIGNVNLLASVLCIAIPLFFAISAAFEGRDSLLALVPLFLAVLVMLASGVSGGAAACAATAVMAVPLLFTDRRRLSRGCRALCICALAAAFAFSIDGGYVGGELEIALKPAGAAWLCLVLAAVFLALHFALPGMTFIPEGRRLRRFFAALAVAGAAAAIIAVWFYPGDSGTLYELSQLMRGHADEGFGSSRILIWRQSLALVPEHPFFGGGPGTLALRLDIDFSRFVPETGKTLTTYVDNAHNVYLQTLAELGAFGAAAYLGIIACAMLMALKKGGDAGKAIFLAVFCCCVQDFFGLGLCVTAPLLWIFMGLSAAFGKTRLH